MSNQPQNPQTPKDAERLEAERLALDLATGLVVRSGIGQFDPDAAAARIGAMTDHELRLELYRLRRSVESGESPLSRGPSPAQKRTQEMLVSRYRQLARSVNSDGSSNGLPPEPGQRRQADELLEELEELEELAELVEAGITVAEDGLLEVDRITDRLHWIAGDLPIAMYHHTSSALLEVIRAEGLKVGKPTNFFNTQQGVYVSTIQAGQPVSVYSRRAARVHGGEPITLRVRRKLSEIKPDPDDADLAWAQGRQYITPSVPPEDIMWDAEEPRAEAKPVATAPESLPADAPPAPARKMRPR